MRKTFAPRDAPFNIPFYHSAQLPLMLTGKAKSAQIMRSQGSRVRPIWSHVRPNFSGVRLKKNFGRTGASSHSRKKTKVSATQKVSLLFDNRHVRLISWSKPIRDSEGRTPPLIGRGPDIPVCVCAFEDACAAAVRERGE